MDGFREEGAPALHSRELLTKSRLRRKRVRARGPEAETMDTRLEARDSLSAREAPPRRRAAARKPAGAVFARDKAKSGGNESDSDSDSESQAKPPAKATSTLARNGPATVRLSGQGTSSLPAAAKTNRPQRITPIPVFATAKSTPTARPSASEDRVAAIGPSPSPAPATPSRAPVASSSAVASVSAPVAPVAAPSVAPDAKDTQPTQSTETARLPAAQATGLRLGVEATKEEDGSEKDLRAGRFSQGAEAGIVIGTLAFIALLGMVIFCYRRKKSRSRGVSGLSSEKGLGFPPRRQTHIMDEAMTAAYAADDRAFAARATPPMPTPLPLRVPERELQSPDQRPVYAAQQPAQTPSAYPPARSPVDQYRTRSMPVSDEPEEAWRTWNPDQSQATRPLNWL